MNTEINTNDSNPISGRLPILAAVLVGIIIIGLLTMAVPKLKYKMSTQEILTEVLKHEDIVKPDKFMEIYFYNDSLYQFIDLRSSQDYLRGHLNGAIHIPLHKLLDPKYKKILNQHKKINILYYSDQCGACGPWMILTQLGYKNNKVLAGGYDYIKSHIIDSFSPMSGDYSMEKPKYDYAKIVNSTAGVSVGQSSSSQAASGGATPPVKKKKGGGGGC
jgi:rhodanese-related sulfurtransferase